MGRGGEDAPGFGGGPFTDAVRGRMQTSDPVCVMHTDSCGTNLGNIQASNLGGTAPAIVSQRREVSRALCYYQFLPGYRYTEAVLSVPKPSKALETVPCMEALTILSRANA